MNCGQFGDGWVLVCDGDFFNIFHRIWPLRIWLSRKLISNTMMQRNAIAFRSKHKSLNKLILIYNKQHMISNIINQMDSIRRS